jgi:hydrogenase-4 component E
MNPLLDAVLVLVVLVDFFALGSSRVPAVVRAVGAQGVLLASLPVLAHQHVAAHFVLIGLGTLLVKGIVFPWLLLRAIRVGDMRRDVEPLVGFTASLLLGGAGTGLALLFSDALPLAPEHAETRLVPAAFATVFCGFLILTTRKKAITQIAGYMILENGIFLFGLLLLDALPLMVEIGVLLDLLVGIFVMGIVLHHIQRTFSTVDTVQFSTLKE